MVLHLQKRIEVNLGTRGNLLGQSVAIEFHSTTLSNGLTILAECDPDVHTSAIGFFVKAGTRDETLPEMGVSHFLEHMMFKGTAKRTADEVNQEFDDIGANYNAFTSHEKTVYYAHVLPEYLPRAIDLLGDMLRPALREKDFTMEKKVILEEISMYDDRPQWRLQDTLLEKYFGDHPLGYRVLGTVDSINALTATQMQSYFEHRYCPDNIVVTAAGQIDFDQLVADIEKVAGHWKPTGATRDLTPPAICSGETALTDATLNRHYLTFICPGPSASDETRYAATVLADVLGDTDGSALYWALIDPGLADEADISHIGQDGVGCFMAYASCDPKRAEQVKTVLFNVLSQAASTITASQVQRTKNKLATSATLHGESPSGRMRALGGQWLALNQYIPLAQEVERLMAVDLDEIQELLAGHPFSNSHLMRLGPQ